MAKRLFAYIKQILQSINELNLAFYIKKMMFFN